MKKKTRNMIGVIAAIFSIIAIIPTARESIINWITDKKPLIVEEGVEYYGTSYEFLTILMEEEISKGLYQPSMHETVDPPEGVLELYIKNQNDRSEVAIKKDLPIRLLNYKKLNDDYFVNALTPGFGGKGGGTQKVQYFYATISPELETTNYAYFIDDFTTFQEFNGLVGDSLLINDTKEYYVLYPGDVDLFYVIIHFTKPGEYRFQIGIEMYEDNGKSKTIWSDKIFSVKILDNLHIWKKASNYSSSKEVDNIIEEVASCTFLERGYTGFFLSHYSCFATDPAFDNTLLLDESIFKSCSDDFQTRLYVGGHAKSCFDSSVLVVYEKPNSLLPGWEKQVDLHNAEIAIIDGPVCESPDFPWWKVMTERGDVGWAPEKTIMSDEIYSLCPSK